MTLSTSRIVRRGVAAVALLSLASCAAPPDAEPGYPNRGCYDNARAGAPDVRYTGEPSRVGNLVHWSSTDGTCTGSAVDADVLTSTLMLAETDLGASVLCDLLLGANGSPQRIDDRLGPWSPRFGPFAFLCTG